VEKFTVHAGRAVPLRRGNVDTDQIIPAVYLKRVSRTGFEDGLFSAWRANEPDFVLNQPRFGGATILVAGPDFGTGSSREHAVWALQDYGFQAVISPRFGDIFRGNALKAGLVPVVLEEKIVQRLWDDVEEDPSTEVTVDIVERQVRWSSVNEQRDAEGGRSGANGNTAVHGFELDDYTRWRLIEGLDDIGLTLRHTDEIGTYEAQRKPWLPTTGVVTANSPVE
jgi:3-isopropylmalate/(R)-2-methylmalate dehydratase small subunit